MMIRARTPPPMYIESPSFQSLMLAETPMYPDARLFTPICGREDSNL
jgi:hypothetical protein